LFEETLAQLDPEKAQTTLEQLQQAARHYQDANGVAAPSEVLLGVGVK
jgi:hypothetical protein